MTDNILFVLIYCFVSRFPNPCTHFGVVQAIHYS